MDETRQPAHAGEVNPEVKHEDSDINVRALAVFTVGFIIFAAVMHVAVWGVYKLLEKEFERRRPTPTTLVDIKEKQRPPEPMLQVNPVGDMNLLIDEQKKLSTGYETDPQSGAVRLPIERAMAVIAHKQMPVRPDDAGQTSPEAITPGGDATVDTPTRPPGRQPVSELERNTEGRPE